jgi:plastocyanin
MRSRWLGAAVLILALGAGLTVMSCKDKSTNPGGTAADLTIGITGQNGANSFFPSPDTVTVGQTVAWHNADGITHTSTSNGIGGWDTGNIPPGGTSVAIRMNTTGNFNYHCSIHPTMVGTLFVKP